MTQTPEVPITIIVVLSPNQQVAPFLPSRLSCSIRCSIPTPAPSYVSLLHLASQMLIESNLNTVSFRLIAPILSASHQLQHQLHPSEICSPPPSTFCHCQTNRFRLIENKKNKFINNLFTTLFCFLYHRPTAITIIASRVSSGHRLWIESEHSLCCLIPLIFCFIISHLDFPLDPPARFKMRSNSPPQACLYARSLTR